MNKLMPFQVKRLFELADLEAAAGSAPYGSFRPLLQSAPGMDETIGRGTVVNFLIRRLLGCSVYLYSDKTIQ